MDAVSKPGADCDTDHHLVVAKFRMKEGSHRNGRQMVKRFNIESLKDPEIARNFQIETENRFQLLIDQDTE